MIKGITCDSRRIKRDSIFVCINGQYDNGYRYVQDAEDRGACAIIADSPIHSSVPVILSCNPRRTMAKLAKRLYNEPDKKMSLVGVTGTNGKTTVTHLIRDILVAAGKKTALVGTNGCYYNHVLTDESFTTHTTPESAELWKILNTMHDMGSEYAVCEVSSHALYFDRVYDVDFKIGVFTNLTREHLDFHRNMENYYNSKKLLFDNSRFCVINTDDEYGKRLFGEFCEKSISIGFDNADIKAEEISYSQNGASFVINDMGVRIKTGINIPGEFSVYNALCAYAVCKKLGIDIDIIKKTLENSNGVKGRAERVDIDTDYSIIIDYAHTPDGLKNIIKTLKNVTKGRVITLFGCGGERDISKRAVMGEISGELSDFTILTSDNERNENPAKIIHDIEKGICNITDNYIIIPDRYRAIEYALNIANSGDTVLLAGKGHEDYIIKQNKKLHFDEREVIKQILKKNQ